MMKKFQGRPKISSERRIEWNKNSRVALINAKNRFTGIIKPMHQLKKNKFDLFFYLPT